MSFIFDMQLVDIVGISQADEDHINTLLLDLWEKSQGPFAMSRVGRHIKHCTSVSDSTNEVSRPIYHGTLQYVTRVHTTKKRRSTETTTNTQYTQQQKTLRRHDTFNLMNGTH